MTRIGFQPFPGAGRRLRAFSLLELLIAVSVSLLMLSLGAPALRDYIQDKRLKAAQHHLLADLGFARQQAIIGNHVTITCPDNGDGQCSGNGNWRTGWIVFADANGDGQRQQSEPLFRTAAGDARVSIRSPDSRPRVRFTPLGAAPASNLSIVLCDQRGLPAGRKLVVSHSGRIRQAAATSSDSGLCTWDAT